MFPKRDEAFSTAYTITCIRFWGVSCKIIVPPCVRVWWAWRVRAVACPPFVPFGRSKDPWQPRRKKIGPDRRPYE